MGKTQKPKPPLSQATNGSETKFTRVRHGQVDMTCPLGCGMWYVKITETERLVYWLHEINAAEDKQCPLAGTRMSALAVVELLAVRSNQRVAATATERKRMIIRADEYVASIKMGRPDYLAGAKALLSYLANEED